MVKMSVCKRNNLCVDCDNEKCFGHGDLEADCPKYRCDRKGEGFMNCKNCAFLKRYQADMREYYKKKEEEEMKAKNKA